MTDKQIEEARRKIPQWKNGVAPVRTPKEERANKELDCRDMINSILCYDGVNNVIQNRYLQKYIDELGAETVQRLIDEQIDDFKKAIIKRNVHTDSEGVSYNSIVWADEQ